MQEKKKFHCISWLLEELGMWFKCYYLLLFFDFELDQAMFLNNFLDTELSAWATLWQRFSNSCLNILNAEEMLVEGIFIVQCNEDLMLHYEW